MAAEYCHVQKKFFCGGPTRQEILKIETCTWNKKTNVFLMFIGFTSEVLKIIKKYLILQKWCAFECNTRFCPKKAALIC